MSEQERWQRRDRKQRHRREAMPVRGASLKRTLLPLLATRRRRQTGQDAEQAEPQLKRGRRLRKR